MKIEKINENQIKCTLTQQDLQNHNIRVNELAYGSEKARELFREMMTRAAKELSFKIEEHTPIMVEAIPESKDSLVLIISKVDNPEEIDTRFAKLSPSPLAAKLDPLLPMEGADDIIDLFRKLKEKRSAALRQKEGEKKEGDASKPTPSKKPTAPLHLMKLYRFDTMDEVILAAKALGGFYQGENTLYKNKKTSEYFLIINQSAHTPVEFNKVCNILSEYAVGSSYTKAAEAHLSEHETVIIKKTALQTLAAL